MALEPGLLRIGPVDLPRPGGVTYRGAFSASAQGELQGLAREHPAPPVTGHLLAPLKGTPKRATFGMVLRRPRPVVHSHTLAGIDGIFQKTWPSS